MSFSWIFAIIVGAFIIFLAIYAVNKLSDSQATVSDVTASKELGILLNPLETGFEETKTSTFTLPKESKLFFRCDTQDDFGNQKIVIRGENFDKFSENNLEVEFQNKYIFAEKILQEREFNLFSKRFSFPFKTATLIYITPAEKNYCFVDPPREVEEDLENFKPKHIFLEDCPLESIEVCFNDDNCDISVKYDVGELKKDGEIFHFQDDALMYGAIFSEKGNYDCQVERLMKKVAILSNIYIEKAVVNPQNGCGQETQDLNSKLRLLESFATNFKSPEDLEGALSLIKDIEQKNKVLDCRLW